MEGAWTCWAGIMGEAEALGAPRPYLGWNCALALGWYLAGGGWYLAGGGWGPAFPRADPPYILGACCAPKNKKSKTSTHRERREAGLGLLLAGAAPLAHGPLLRLVAGLLARLVGVGTHAHTPLKPVGSVDSAKGVGVLRGAR